MWHSCTIKDWGTERNSGERVRAGSPGEQRSVATQDRLINLELISAKDKKLSELCWLCDKIKMADPSAL